MMPDASPGFTSNMVPSPDPTKLTTDAVAALKEQLVELFGKEMRFIQHEIDRLRAEIDQRPNEIREAIGHLTVLVGEKFKGVEQQFIGRDVALAAALLAQKASVDEQNRSNAAAAAKAEAGATDRKSVV